MELERKAVMALLISRMFYIIHSILLEISNLVFREGLSKSTVAMHKQIQPKHNFIV